LAAALPLTVTFVIHDTLLTAVGKQFAAEHVTLTLPLPPFAAGLALAAASVYVQPFA
jgi:hypothetical protein